MATFESLPAELKLLVLSQVPDFPTLISLITVSHSCRSIFAGNPYQYLKIIHQHEQESRLEGSLALEAIIYLDARRLLKPETDFETLVAWEEKHKAVIREKKWDERLDVWLSEYAGVENTREAKLTLQDVEQIAKDFEAVGILVDLFCKEKLPEFEDGVPATYTEKHRIGVAVYRLGIYAALHKNRVDMPLRDPDGEVPFPNLQCDQDGNPYHRSNWYPDGAQLFAFLFAYETIFEPWAMIAVFQVWLWSQVWDASCGVWDQDWIGYTKVETYPRKKSDTDADAVFAGTASAIFMHLDLPGLASLLAMSNTEEDQRMDMLRPVFLRPEFDIELKNTYLLNSCYNPEKWLDAFEVEDISAFPMWAEVSERISAQYRTTELDSSILYDENNYYRVLGGAFVCGHMGWQWSVDEGGEACVWDTWRLKPKQDEEELQEKREQEEYLREWYEREAERKRAEEEARQRKDKEEAEKKETEEEAEMRENLSAVDIGGMDAEAEQGNSNVRGAGSGGYP